MVKSASSEESTPVILFKQMMHNMISCSFISNSVRTLRLLVLAFCARFNYLLFYRSMGRSRRTAAAGILQLRLLIVACSVLILLPILSMAMADNSSNCRTRPANPCGPSSFSFYLHNMVYNPAVDNKNSFDSVYGLPLNVSWPNPLFFGLTSTFEDPLTIGPSNSSQQIGIAQGIWQYDSKVDFTLFHLFTANITTGDHKGTIDIFGQVRETNPVRYLSVIGGTGDFLGARGLASCRLIVLDHTPPAKWTLSFDLDLYY